jgi:hypothetical protein
MLKLLRSAAVLTVFAAAACSDSIGPGDVEGTYTLRSVNSDNTAPFLVFQDASGTGEILSGDFILDSDGTFSSTLTVRDTFQSVVTDQSFSAIGTYSLRGRNITFEDDFGDVLVGRISGDSIIFDDQPGVRLVFTRD